jgi:hypothetical protein
MAIVRKLEFFCGVGGTNAEPLCVELCNLVECCIFVNYLICLKM